MQLNEHLRKAIHCVRQGLVGKELANAFFPDGVPLPKEGALWDYKLKLTADKLGYAELTKDILSFFNSYGGYIFLGVSETKRDECFDVVGFDRPGNFVQDINASLQAYSSVDIDVQVSDFAVGEKTVTAVFVPARPLSQSPAFLVKNGPEEKAGRPLFYERTTYFRHNKKAAAATIASQWEFLNSARNADELLLIETPLSSSSQLSRVIPNNLPDKNLICAYLFGRDEILSALWAWIPDELEPVRLLAGYGGRGKTSIAYEFASHFTRNAPNPFMQVLWVSAKRRQFRADRNEYIELPECWYSTPRELLESLCIGTAALTEKELETESESEYTLQKKLRESLRLLPALIVVDDIDSLDQAQQKRVFELVQQVSAGASSKFLLTTRANFAFSDSQCIEVPGLEGDPYRLLVEDRVSRLGLSLNSRQVRQLHNASGGSPLWTDSILRLMKQGYNFDQALIEWKGKPGEDARSAALRKELEALSVGSKRILYAASIKENCSREELLEITKIGKTEFAECITELQALFLVEAPKIIENEPRFFIAEATAAAVIEAGEDLVPDHKRLLAAVREFAKRARAISGGNARGKVGEAVRQAMAFISAGQSELAIQTVEAALRGMPDHPDLLMLKGRCLREARPSDAIDAFSNAYKRGQRRPLLFEMWYQALTNQGHYATAADVANLAIDNELDKAEWLPRRAQAWVHIGIIKNRDSEPDAAVDMLQKAADDLVAAIRTKRGGRGHTGELSRDVQSIHDGIWSIVSKGSGLVSDLRAFDAAKKMFERGDHRIENVERLVAATMKLVTGLELSSDSSAARAGRTRVSDALQALYTARKNSALSVDAYPTYDEAILKLESV